MHQLLKFITVTSLAAIVGGCASQTDVVNVQRDMEELKTRIIKSERDLSSIRSEAKEGIDRTIKTSQKDLDDIRKGGADLQAAIEGVKVDMQVLTGKLDDVSVLAKKPADDLSLLKEDVERRLSGIDDKFKKMVVDIEDLRKQMTDLQTKTAERPENLFQAGTDLLAKGDNPGTREKFAKFIEQNPKQPAAAAARYMLGESYYNEKNYEQAILEYQDVIKNFPGNEKVPAALLKQAMAFQELKDVKSAKYVYKKLAEDYATTDEGKKAKEKLKELK